MSLTSNATPHCIVPWGAISLLPDGTVIPCAASNAKLPEVVLGNIRRQEFRDIWAGARAQQFRQAHYEMPFTFKGCAMCIQQDAQSDVSKRKEMLAKYGDIFKPVVDYKNYADPGNIIYLDMALSSLCNLNCSMCSSTYSTNWVDLEKKLTENGFQFKSKPTSAAGSENIRGNLRSIFPYLKHLRFLFLKGGEPFLNNDTHWFLDKLVEMGGAENVTLSIVTNGTIYNEKVVNLFDKFKRVELIVSLDASGDLYKYIRGGHKHTSEKVIENISRIKKASTGTWVTISPTLQAYNALRFEELIKFSFDLADEVYCNNWVLEPSYQSIIALPQRLHPQVIEQMEKCIAFFELWNPGNRSLPFFRYIIQYMNKEIDWLKVHSREEDPLAKLIHFTKIIDEERKLKIKDIIPEMDFYS